MIKLICFLLKTIYLYIFSIHRTMSDYSFMKTGFQSPTNTEGMISMEMLEEINILISYITSNAMLRASEYVAISNRSIVTREDFIMGMKYEAFSTLSSDSFQTEFDEYKQEYFNEVYGEEIYSEEEEEEIEIVNDTEQEPFYEITMEEQLQLTDKEKDFVRKMHNFTKHWNKWNPKNDFQKYLKNIINQIENKQASEL